MNLTKHIRKPMPAPTSAHKGVKDAPRSKAVDLSEWEFDTFHINDSIEVDAVRDDDAPTSVIERSTRGRSWSIG